MTPEQIKQWRINTMHATQREAAAMLGMALKNYQALENGANWKTGAPIAIDRRTALACAAIAAGLAPFGTNDAPIEKSKPARRRQAANRRFLSD